MAASLAPAYRHHWRSNASISRSRAGSITPLSFPGVTAASAGAVEDASDVPASDGGAGGPVSLLIAVLPPRSNHPTVVRRRGSRGVVLLTSRRAPVPVRPGGCCAPVAGCRR